MKERVVSNDGQMVSTGGQFLIYDSFPFLPSHSDDSLPPFHFHSLDFFFGSNESLPALRELRFPPFLSFDSRPSPRLTSLTIFLFGSTFFLSLTAESSATSS